MKKTIKIFLASSLLELASERMEIENFIHNLSNKYEEKYNIKIQPILCEHIDPAIALGRKQEEYNELIRGCDFCFFIFFTKAGEYVVEEFKVAYEQFSKTKKPQIYTYFKKLDGSAAEQSLLDFMEMLDKTLGHFYNSFSHLDTLKLRMVLCVTLLEMDSARIETKNNACLIDGEAVLSLDNVAEFSNNKILQETLKKLAETEQKCAALKDSDNVKMYADTCYERHKLQQEAENLRKRIFDFSLGILHDTVHGTASARQLEAFAHLEKGDLQSAIDVLNISDIKNDFLASQKMIEEARIASITKFLREIKMLIRVLAIKYDYENRTAEMEEAFLAAVPIVIKEKTEIDILTAFIDFLTTFKHDYPAAAEIGEKLSAIYDGTGTNIHTRLELYENLQYIYKQADNTKQAKAYFVRSLELLERLYATDNLRYGASLIEKYHDAAADCSDRRGKRQYLLKAINISEALVKIKPLAFADSLADLYNELALLYRDCHAYKKSEKTYLKAIALYEALQINEPHAMHQTITSVFLNLSFLYQSKKRYEKRLASHLEKTIALLERLESGSLTALSDTWSPDLEAFAEIPSVDTPLKILPEFLPVEPTPLACGKFALELALAYREYGFIIGKTKEYWTKAYEIATKYPDSSECEQLADDLRTWLDLWKENQ